MGFKVKKSDEVKRKKNEETTERHSGQKGVGPLNFFGSVPGSNPGSVSRLGTGLRETAPERTPTVDRIWRKVLDPGCAPQTREEIFT